MATLKAIRTAVQTVVEAALPELAVYRRVVLNPNLPCVIVRPLEVAPLAMARGAMAKDFVLTVIVGGDEDVAQDALDEYVDPAGPKSVWQVIWNNRSLGLAGVDAQITAMTDYDLGFDVIGTPHQGANLRLSVATTGTS